MVYILNEWTKQDAKQIWRSPMAYILHEGTEQDAGRIWSPLSYRMLLPWQNTGHDKGWRGLEW